MSSFFAESSKFLLSLCSLGNSVLLVWNELREVVRDGLWKTRHEKVKKVSQKGIVFIQLMLK